MTMVTVEYNADALREVVADYRYAQAKRKFEVEVIPYAQEIVNLAVETAANQAKLGGEEVRVYLDEQLVSAHPEALDYAIVVLVENGYVVAVDTEQPHILTVEWKLSF